MSVVLRVSGRYSVLEDALEQQGFSESGVSRRNRQQRPAEWDGSSTFNLTVSDHLGNDVAGWLDEADECLSLVEAIRREADLWDSVESMQLDVMIEVAQEHLLARASFPAEFLHRCARHGLDLTITAAICSHNTDS